jgi:tyrosyl-tRNA synthetase
MFNAFTFLETEEIEDIISFHNKNPEKRNAQKILGEKIVGMLFTEEEANRCKNSCQAHYTNFSATTLTETNQSADDLEKLLKNCQTTEIHEESLDKLSISNLCVNEKILPTKAQCKRLIQSGSLFINNSKINDDVLLSKEMLLGGRYLVLKTGKKHTHVFEIKKKDIIIENINIENVSANLAVKH